MATEPACSPEGDQDDYPGQMLQQAALYDNRDLLVSLLQGEERQHVDSADTYGRTPLFTAVSNSSLDCTKALLDHKANPNIKTNPKYGSKTALHESVEKNQLIFVELLMKHKADLSLSDRIGDKPLDIARKQGFQDIVCAIDKEIERRQQRKKSCVRAIYNALAQGDIAKAKKYGTEIPGGISSIVNYAPEGEESLLCRACERGNLELVQFLLDNGADGTFMLDNGLSPLHIACMSGNAGVVNAILESFPELIRTPSSCDGALPIHTASEAGYTDVVKVLLDFPYPDSVRQMYTDSEGKRTYTSGISMNSREGHGKTPLHLAASKNSPDTTKLLLSHQVDTMSKKGVENMDSKFTPVDVDAIDLDGFTPLLIAVRGDEDGSFLEVAKHLIEHKANVNKKFIDLLEKQNSTPLIEACKKSDIQMVNLLLQHGALDDKNFMLTQAIHLKSDEIISAMLRHKTHADQEYKINKLLMLEKFDTNMTKHKKRGMVSVDYKTLGTLNSRKRGFPTTPVVINWHNLGLEKIDHLWLLQATIVHNSQLAKPSKKTLSVAMFAITRIDLSQNRLTSLPLVVFQLCSLKLLNLSDNLIENLPTGLEANTSMQEMDNNGWNCPCVENINLSENTLTSLPAELFCLMSLQKLTASKNRLRTVPYEIWFAPKLGMLDLSHNKLESFPVVPQSDLQNGQVQFKEAVKTEVVMHNEPKQNGVLPNVVSSQVKHQNRWAGKVKVRRSMSMENGESLNRDTWLRDLDLSYNSFMEVPVGLSCLASHLERLNLSYNRLDQIGPLDQYPVSLQKLDLSFNRILSTILFDARVEEENEIPCYKSLATSKKYKKGNLNENPASHRRVHMAALGEGGTCPHRSHKKLENLKHLWLQGNKLSELPLLSKDEGLTLFGGDDASSGGEQSRSSTQTSQSSSGTSSDPDSNSANIKARLLFPNLSVLDASLNSITVLPAEICEMAGLSEFKVKENRIRELPPELGLLSKKLWNLDFTGCPVEKELSAILGDKIKKTGTVLGYLKSLKEDATSYNRMKLMFVGVQGIGKTSLLQLLRKEGKTQQPRYRTWAERMGIQATNQSGMNMSTVGVDIGDLLLTRAGREVIFKTWDFGGQREYYATHQYFLSKRSLYLVMWKVTDGERAVEGIQQWLVNIQARAPNSPVIIVGTHIDEIDKRIHPPGFLEDLHHMVVTRYVHVPEPEKAGLPRVMSAIEVSCKKKQALFSSNNISQLVDIIWKVVNEERVPGNQQVKLLEQKIPSSYKILEDVVTQVAKEKTEPVVSDSEYKYYVTDRMSKMYATSFKDSAELNQATQFLHDNGVLLHYDDVNLRNVYFLDPQWLCDVLAKVVTIKEINSFAKSGVMKISDLKFLFRSSSKADSIKDYIIDLLNKFEVALQYDEEYLLIPSLLPSESEYRRSRNTQPKWIPAGGFDRMDHDDYWAALVGPEISKASSKFYVDTPVNTPTDSENTDFPPLGMDQSTSTLTADPSDQMRLTVSENSDPSVSLCRLYLMSYFPSGFWPRLITRLIADKSISGLVKDLYPLPECVQGMFLDVENPCYEVKWNCWQTGMDLYYMKVKICSIREIPKDPRDNLCNYRWCQMLIQDQDTSWAKVNTDSTAILEILIPNSTLGFEWEQVVENSDVPSLDNSLEPVDQVSKTDPESSSTSDYEYVPDPHDTDIDFTVVDNPRRKLDQNLKHSPSRPRTTTNTSENRVELVYPTIQSSAALLARIVEHVDNLLEDWYPDLGLRFVQNSLGMYLITRIVPCMHCLKNQVAMQAAGDLRNSWMMIQDDFSSTEQVSISARNQVHSPTSNVQTCSSLPNMLNNNWVQHNPVTRTVGNVVSYAVDKLPRWRDRTRPNNNSESNDDRLYCYLAEQCHQAAQANKIVFCPLHGNIGPYFMADGLGLVLQCHVAPDAVLLDIGDKYLYEHDKVTRGLFLGKGSFGAVFAGTVTEKEYGGLLEVAIKMLQPVYPGDQASQSHKAQYQMDQKKWDRDPMKSTCEAYLNARKELSILLSLKHPNIVPLVGVSLKPLCLLLELAPRGALNEVIKEYRRAGARFPFVVIQKIVIQVASALEYLHAHQIIYRDLKSENVLVWSLPQPHDLDLSKPMKVKLADYGVSRTVLPSGTKGFAGTPPFIAPEIIQHSGEESYTEKVDCFSFGMFLYELLMLKLPFEGQESAALGNIKGYVLNGGRPAISDHDLIYPTHMLDLMTQCWSQEASERPSATDIISLACRPEFCHLRDVVSLEGLTEITATCSLPVVPWDDRQDYDEEEQSKSEIWFAGTIEGQQVIKVMSVHDQLCYQAKSFSHVPLDDGPIQLMCVVESNIWCCSRKIIHVYSANDGTKKCHFEPKPGYVITTLVYDNDSKVYVVLESGRIVVCRAAIPDKPGRSSQIITEFPNNNRPTHCITVLMRADGVSELWCGQHEGRIYILSLTERRGVKPTETISHSREQLGPGEGSKGVSLLVAESPVGNAVWSYIYPESVVYRWDAFSKKITGSLDCGKIVPRHERIPTRILKEDGMKLLSGKCQVISFEAMERHLYVTTSWGCVIVADAYTMEPLSMFRCYYDATHSIKPTLIQLTFRDPHDLGQQDSDNPSTPAIATVGRGYRDVMEVFKRTQSSRVKPPEDEYTNYMLIWSAVGWRYSSEDSVVQARNVHHR